MQYCDDGSMLDVGRCGMWRLRLPTSNGSFVIALFYVHVDLATSYSCFCILFVHIHHISRMDVSMDALLSDVTGGNALIML